MAKTNESEPPLARTPSQLSHHEFEVMSRRMRTVTDRKQQRLKHACPVDIRDCGGHYLVSAEVPGVRGEEIDYQLDQGRVLHLKVRRPQPPEHGQAYLAERRYESADRDFLLPETVDASRAKKHMGKGVFYLSLPKADQENA